MRLKPKKRKRPVLVILCVIICFAILCGVLIPRMQPVIFRYATSVAETMMLNSANNAVLSILEEENISYSDIVNLTFGPEGYVASLEIDIYKVNSLKSRISGMTAKLVDSKEFYEVGVPIGSFIGDSLTMGWGPKLPFKMQLTSTAVVDFSHEFKDAGINQVLHIIMINIDIKGSFVVAGYNKGVTARTSAIAAQTVIVGKTPDAFTTVIETEEDNTGGLVNDYGADNY